MKLVLTVLAMGLCLPLMGDEKGITEHMRDGWQKDILDFVNQDAGAIGIMAVVALGLFFIFNIFGHVKGFSHFQHSIVTPFSRRLRLSFTERLAICLQNGQRTNSSAVACENSDPRNEAVSDTVSE